MFNANLTVLSYHKFGEKKSDYAFSRTYDQFKNDLETKDFDWITMDDGHISILHACNMMKEKNFRAKIFISTALIGQPGYCSWDDIWLLSRDHDICNHSHNHVNLLDLFRDEILSELSEANKLIKQHIGIVPRFFVPPWNQYNDMVCEVSAELNMQLVRDRINMTKDHR